MSIYYVMGIILKWKKFKCILEIDILWNYLWNILGVLTPEGWFLRIWVSKWYPDALLAKTSPRLAGYHKCGTLLNIYFICQQCQGQVGRLEWWPCQVNYVCECDLWITVRFIQVCQIFLTHSVHLTTFPVYIKVSSPLPELNLLILTAPKSSLTMIFCRQKQSQENIWWGNINQNITHNFPSNILSSHSQFQIYCEKYHRSRQQFLEELFSS